MLQYLDEQTATETVATKLRHTSGVLALSGPACPDMDNSMLDHSQLRAYDHSLIHNFDQMVTAAGGHVVSRRWEGRESVEGKRGAYLIVAAPDHD